MLPPGVFQARHLRCRPRPTANSLCVFIGAPAAPNYMACSASAQASPAGKFHCEILSSVHYIPGWAAPRGGAVGSAARATFGKGSVESGPKLDDKHGGRQGGPKTGEPHSPQSPSLAFVRARGENDWLITCQADCGSPADYLPDKIKNIQDYPLWITRGYLWITLTFLVIRMTDHRSRSLEPVGLIAVEQKALPTSRCSSPISWGGIGKVLPGVAPAATVMGNENKPR